MPFYADARARIIGPHLWGNFISSINIYLGFPKVFSYIHGLEDGIFSCIAIIVGPEPIAHHIKLCLGKVSRPCGFTLPPGLCWSRHDKWSQHGNWSQPVHWSQPDNWSQLATGHNLILVTHGHGHNWSLATGHQNLTLTLAYHLAKVSGRYL